MGILLPVLLVEGIEKDRLTSPIKHSDARMTCAGTAAKQG